MIERWFCEHVVHWSVGSQPKSIHTRFIRQKERNWPRAFGGEELCQNGPESTQKVQKKQQGYYRLVVINHTQSAVQFSCWLENPSIWSLNERREDVFSSAHTAKVEEQLRTAKVEMVTYVEAFYSRNTKGGGGYERMLLWVLQSEAGNKYVSDQSIHVSNGKFQGDSNLKTDISSVMFSCLNQHML